LEDVWITEVPSWKERQSRRGSLMRFRLFNRLGENSDNPRRRRNLYRLKHKKLSLGIARFADFFQLISVEINGTGTLLVLIRLADGKERRALSVDDLTADAQERVRTVLAARLTTTKPSSPLPLAA